MSIDTHSYVNILDAEPYDLSPEIKDPLFLNNLIEELNFHYINNDLYQKFCKNQNFIPSEFNGNLEDIPPIPVHVFKALGHKLSSVETGLIKGKLQSSATSGIPSTILLDKVTAKRQRIAMARVMKHVLGSKKRPFCIMDIDPSSSESHNLGARLAAINGYINFASTANYFVGSEDASDQLEFLENNFVNHINNLDPDIPIVIFGFTFVLYHTVFKNLKDKKISFKLPKGSQVIHIGGWKKLESQKVDKNTFNNHLSDILGVSPHSITDIYGFTEQMGLNYPDCRNGWKHVPSYSKVIVRNENDMSINPEGTQGLLQFLSPLQHSYPGNVVLTDDIGVLRSGTCDCGLIGDRFKVLGRAEKAEIRGCGEVMADKIVEANRNIADKNIDFKIDVLHAPSNISHSLDPLIELENIFNAVKEKQIWLSEQPSEALIGLIDLARKKWSIDENLDQYKDMGLNFLSSWCEPSRISNLLDTGLHGNRGHLDYFIPRKDISHSSLKAMPRGTVCHWLSGNVPLLGMFALIQSILSKNGNILKVSAGESQALPLILKTFKDLEYTTPGGYKIKGNDLLDTIGVIYFDRSQQEIATYFSKNADVRIAWGGREAIESISSLPKKFTAQDIIFGPKISMMAVGKEFLDSEKSIRKLVRRAATDSSVFDQYACASPHTIFVEEGGDISPLEFSKLLAKAMEKALIRLPTVPPNKGQANKIRSKIAEYDFIGNSLADDNLRWAVLFSEDAELVEPTYQRVITVKGVKDIFDVLDSIHEDIQTVGLAMKGEKRLRFAEDILKKGPVRCPDIGYMTHFDSPWDGVFVLDRLVRWVTLGGPL